MTKRIPKTRWLIAILAALLLLTSCSVDNPFSQDEATPTTATSPTTEATTATDGGGGTTGGGDHLSDFVPRELAEGEHYTAPGGTCIEGDVTVILTAGVRPVFDDLTDTGHLTCFRSDTDVVSTFPSHVSAATQDEHIHNMLSLDDQCFDGSHGCPSLHVLVIANGAIEEDFWVNQ